MRLVSAELLKIRRRAMTYVLPITLVVVMLIVTLLMWTLIAPFMDLLEGAVPVEAEPWRLVYAVVGDFAFGLGSMLAIIYAGAIAGGDYTWGVLRNAIARGESRVRYLLAKAIALAIAIAVGAAIVFSLGVVLVALLVAGVGVDVGAMLSLDALGDFAAALGLGTLVLLERAAIGLAVAVVLRSQVAGIVVGVVLYIAEPIIGTIAALISAPAQLVMPPSDAPSVLWSQYLPFSIGSNVLNEASAALPALAGGMVANVPLVEAVPLLLAYLAAAMAVAALVLRRQELV